MMSEELKLLPDHGFSTRLQQFFALIHGAYFSFRTPLNGPPPSLTPSNRHVARSRFTQSFVTGFWTWLRSLTSPRLYPLPVFFAILQLRLNCRYPAISSDFFRTRFGVLVGSFD